MSGATHTPGPWLVKPNIGQVIADDPRQTIICDVSGSPSNDQAKADARLIAAAPDLLAALQWFVENDDTNRGGDWEDKNSFWIAGLERGIAAIRLAETGERS